MIYRKNRDGNCWWCGQIANSREHRHKKSDFKKVFGRGKFDSNHTPVIVRDGKLIDIQGPNSDLLKFETVLCSTCNSTKSRPFDLAYDTFIDYIQNNQNEIICKLPRIGLFKSRFFF